MRYQSSVWNRHRRLSWQVISADGQCGGTAMPLRILSGYHFDVQGMAVPRPLGRPPASADQAWRAAADWGQKRSGDAALDRQINAHPSAVRRHGMKFHDRSLKHTNVRTTIRPHAMQEVGVLAEASEE